MTMPFFRKKPVVIEARQFYLDAFRDLRSWVGPDLTIEPLSGTHHIHTLEGPLHVSPGDWIIRGVKGEFYPCKPDIFEKTYEPADAARAGTGDAREALVEAARRVVDEYRTDLRAGKWSDTLLAAVDDLRSALADAENGRTVKPPEYCDVCPHALFLHNEDGTCGCGINCPAERALAAQDAGEAP
jgi:hypothetical protein